MICYNCKREAKEFYLVKNGPHEHESLLCPVCQRKRTGKSWRFYRLLQILGWI